ncbi:hypothetical protein TELCIR_09074 [Teladorsagia circumcincta]|uniref:Uncharacterized protein n=1 Tax=Teladorsagia circumcincta TaxID=45464 RepID=A0A2G9UFU8_TELCI|nr:hypothetical protein TELCIR_09074 [Teladorsagia circumcincta]
MKLFVLIFCVHILQVILAFEEDRLDSLRAQQIPPEAQVLSGAPLVEYLKKNQKLFEVEPNPKVEYYKNMLMDLEFAHRKQKPIVMDEKDNGDDIPERLAAIPPEAFQEEL